MCACKHGDLGEEPHFEFEHFVGPEVKVSFEESACVPGMDRLVQNSLHDACVKIEGFASLPNESIQVPRFFTNQYYLDMLEHSNLSPVSAHWVLKQLKTCGMPVPCGKRFGTVVAFLDIWLFLSSEIHRFSDPSKWQKPPGAQREPEAGDENFCDVNKLTQAIWGETFQALGLFIYCSN